jgi:hypothetical protein
MNHPGSVDTIDPTLRVKKLDILGCQTGTYFEYPKFTDKGGNTA